MHGVRDGPVWAYRGVRCADVGHVGKPPASANKVCAAYPRCRYNRCVVRTRKFFGITHEVSCLSRRTTSYIAHARCFLPALHHIARTVIIATNRLRKRLQRLNTLDDIRFAFADTCCGGARDPSNHVLVKLLPNVERVHGDNFHKVQILTKSVLGSHPLHAQFARWGIYGLLLPLVSDERFERIRVAVRIERVVFWCQRWENRVDMLGLKGACNIFWDSYRRVHSFPSCLCHLVVLYRVREYQFYQPFECRWHARRCLRPPSREAGEIFAQPDTNDRHRVADYLVNQKKMSATDAAHNSSGKSYKKYVRTTSCSRKQTETKLKNLFRKFQKLSDDCVANGGRPLLRYCMLERIRHEDEENRCWMC